MVVAASLAASLAASRGGRGGLLFAAAAAAGFLGIYQFSSFGRSNSSYVGPVRPPRIVGAKPVRGAATAANRAWLFFAKRPQNIVLGVLCVPGVRAGSLCSAAKLPLALLALVLLVKQSRVRLRAS